MDHRPRKRLTYANVMATLAVFLVLGGGTALAAYVVSSNSQIGPGTVSGHKPPSGDHSNIIPGSINAADLANNSVSAAKLGAAAKFRKVTQTFGTVGPTMVLSLGGLKVAYTCTFNSAFDVPSLSARTTNANAAITDEVTHGGGSTFTEDLAFQKTDHFALTQGDSFGQGTATYSAPNGSVVTLTFGFDGSTSCLVHGLALSR